MYAVTPRLDKYQGIEHMREELPVAYFQFHKHANDFGSQLWEGYFDINHLQLAIQEQKKQITKVVDLYQEEGQDLYSINPSLLHTPVRKASAVVTFIEGEFHGRNDVPG